MPIIIMKRTHIVILLFVIILTLVLFRFRDIQGLKNAPTSGIRVVTSFYPLYFFASEIGKENAHVVNITPSGAEPHDYEPTTYDVTQIEKSKLLIVNGAGLEPWVEKLQESLDKYHIEKIAVAQDIADLKIEDDNEQIIDPHIWLSPKRAKLIVANVTDTFIQLDPSHEASYRVNEAILIQKLDELDQNFRKGLASCRQQNIITSHAAFGYIAQDYGLTQIAISGLNPEEEPSPQQLATIAQRASQNNIEYIFFETLVSPRLAETIAREVGAKTLMFNPLEGLTQQEAEDGKDYFSIQTENINSLRIALECI
jgi:zinc transport system substrate-binding protein